MQQRFETLLDEFDQLEWSKACRKMQVCIMRGLFDYARQELDSFLSSLVPESVSLDSPIWSLYSVPYRVLAKLEGEGYATIRAVAGASDDELLAVTDIDRVRLGQIRKALENLKRSA